ncbi:uncharacterized protein MYCFIDRAFT_85091 [Pseudocercospora fijiensis CIRAD86]|uniref:Uncharacterized protein n=1 Tax=Pseudocercospora fijiensis (strain CIRAD86) TaxID=383855 RepID=M3B2V2_PSEFD|nr:uncharacterized protein MYCFIDRAFT_85091 [Pseudocercospora fijiensis CIRAD86]EME83712.1 hypothetical protein MYCFIDRAFT_85091 [Pseudocercospora fijiensis CIRAD86]
MSPLITTEAQASDLIVQMQTTIDKTKTEPTLNTETTGYERLNIVLEDTAKRCKDLNKTEVEDTCHWLLKEFDNHNTLKVDAVDRVMLGLLVQVCEEKLPDESCMVLKKRLVEFCGQVRAASNSDQSEEGLENAKKTHFD